MQRLRAAYRCTRLTLNLEPKDKNGYTASWRCNRFPNEIVMKSLSDFTLVKSDSATESAFPLLVQFPIFFAIHSMASPRM